MQKLSIKQINNLITGNSLAIEMLSRSKDTRAFVVIHAYNASSRAQGDRCVVLFR